VINLKTRLLAAGFFLFNRFTQLIFFAVPLLPVWRNSPKTSSFNRFLETYIPYWNNARASGRGFGRKLMKSTIAQAPLARQDYRIRAVKALECNLR
jgi:hypothetical protein